MKEMVTRKTVSVPENVQVTIDQSRVFVKGPLGQLQRNFEHAFLNIRCSESGVVVETMWPDKKQAAKVGTIRSHIQNMILGVTKGFIYKLKMVYAHFPMSVKVEDTELTIENFNGERKPRKVKVPDTVAISVMDDDIIVKGLDLEEVSQTAANIQQATRIKNKDPRVFLDGIYVYEKGVET
jgi:large subunit ribosomal protein L6